MGELITLDKAKETLNELTRYNFREYNPNASHALKLGIEAIKVLQHGRLIGAHHDPDCLPGETEE